MKARQALGAIAGIMLAAGALTAQATPTRTPPQGKATPPATAQHKSPPPASTAATTVTLKQARPADSTKHVATAAKATDSTKHVAKRTAHKAKPKPKP